FGLPATDALLSVLVLLNLGSRGDEAELAWPAHGEVVVREAGRFAQMGVPAFVCADVEHAVAGVCDNLTVIADTQCDVFSWGHGGSEHDVDHVVPASARFLDRHTFVLEKGKRVATRILDAVSNERASQLEANVADSAGLRVQANGRGGLQRNVGKNG